MEKKQHTIHKCQQKDEKTKNSRVEEYNKGNKKACCWRDLKDRGISLIRRKDYQI